MLEVFETIAPKWQKEGFDEVAKVLRGTVGLLRQSQTLNLQLEQEVQANVARPIRDLMDNEFRRAKEAVKKAQEQRQVYNEVSQNMEKERKKGKVTALDAENQVKRAAADYEVLEADCKKVLRGAVESAQTTTITLSCNYLKSYQTYWDSGSKMREVLDATGTKHRAIAAARAEKLSKEYARVYTVSWKRA